MAASRRAATRALATTSMHRPLGTGTSRFMSATRNYPDVAGDPGAGLAAHPHNGMLKGQRAAELGDRLAPELHQLLADTRWDSV